MCDGPWEVKRCPDKESCSWDPTQTQRLTLHSIPLPGQLLTPGSLSQDHRYLPFAGGARAERLPASEPQLEGELMGFGVHTLGCTSCASCTCQ